MTNLSKAKATATLNAIKRQWSFLTAETGDPGPQLIMGWTDSGAPAIVWEDGAPYDWPQYTSGGKCEDLFGYDVPAAKLPSGVYAEPYNGCVLALYPA